MEVLPGCMEELSFRNQTTEVLNSFDEKTVIFVSSELHYCHLLFHEMVKQRKREN